MSRANIECLIQTVKDEIDSIIISSASRSPLQFAQVPNREADELNSLILEFNTFNETLNQIINTSTYLPQHSDGESHSCLVIFIELFMKLIETKDLDGQLDSYISKKSASSCHSIESKLNCLFEQFRLIVKESIILQIQAPTSSLSSVRKNQSLEAKFQVFFYFVPFYDFWISVNTALSFHVFLLIFILFTRL